MSPSRNYAAELDKIKPKLATGSQSWIVNYFGIVATDSNCQSNPEYQFFSPGIKYMELAKASGGVIESICKSDLSNSVASLHARLLEVMTEYFLAGTPKTASIQVFIDGIKVEKNDVNGWSYDSVRNSVIFRGTATPKPTSKIKVLYDLEKL